MPVAGAEPYVNIDVAAEFLSVSVNWLYRAADAEGVPCYRIGRHRRYLLSDLDAFMRRDAR